MDKTDFNIMCAKLDGHTDFNSLGVPVVYEHDGEYEKDYYSDMNYLMPVAWKYIGEMTKYDDEWIVESLSIHIVRDKEPVEAIRQCLIEIGKEKGLV